MESGLTSREAGWQVEGLLYLREEHLPISMQHLGNNTFMFASQKGSLPTVIAYRITPLVA